MEKKLLLSDIAGVEIREGHNEVVRAFILKNGKRISTPDVKVIEISKDDEHLENLVNSIDYELKNKRAGEYTNQVKQEHYEDLFQWKFYKLGFTRPRYVRDMASQFAKQLDVDNKRMSATQKAYLREDIKCTAKECDELIGEIVDTIRLMRNFK